MRAKNSPIKTKPDQGHQLKLTIQYGRGVRIAPLSERRVRLIARSCLELDFSATIRFVTRAEAQGLNKQYRSKTYIPNVLTFSYLPEPAADIVICTRVVRQQARQQGKSFSDHLAHLLVHGMLHAQGYEHDTPAGALEMETAEKRILRRHGVADPY